MKKSFTVELFCILITAIIPKSNCRGILNELNGIGYDVRAGIEDNETHKSRRLLYNQMESTSSDESWEARPSQKLVYPTKVLYYKTKQRIPTKYPEYMKQFTKIPIIQKNIKKYLYTSDSDLEETTRYRTLKTTSRPNFNIKYSEHFLNKDNNHRPYDPRRPSKYKYEIIKKEYKIKYNNPVKKYQWSVDTRLSSNSKEDALADAHFYPTGRNHLTTEVNNLANKDPATNNDIKYINENKESTLASQMSFTTRSPFNPTTRYFMRPRKPVYTQSPEYNPFKSITQYFIRPGKTVYTQESEYTPYKLKLQDNNKITGESGDNLSVNQSTVSNFKLEPKFAELESVKPSPKCTTEVPLPKIDPTYAPNETKSVENQKSSGVNTENEKEDLKGYIPPVPGRVPKHYIDDEK